MIHAPDKPDEPLARIEDGHGVIFFNFRGDRAIEISRAFVEKDFHGFERKAWPRVLYAGMVEYDGDTHLPPLPSVKWTSAEWMPRMRGTR